MCRWLRTFKFLHFVAHFFAHKVKIAVGVNNLIKDLWAVIRYDKHHESLINYFGEKPIEIFLDNQEENVMSRKSTHSGA